MAGVPHITVCVCTYKRPQLLLLLLRSLAQQRTAGKFTYSVVVVDNDRSMSAREIAEDFAASSGFRVTYDCEPEQNIARARNRGLTHVKGEFVAFFDDDQLATEGWLLTLLEYCERSKADGILGPVKPKFEVPPPAWVTKGKFCERPSYRTGFEIDWRKGRTGNVLLRTRIFPSDGEVFHPTFLTGEDQDFFRRMIEKGHRFLWCEEAVAYEIVPPRRWQRRFMVRRALLRGQVSLRHPSVGATEVAMSAVAIVVYSAALPFALLSGQHRFMRYLVSLCDHLGKVLASIGLEPIRHAYVTE